MADGEAQRAEGGQPVAAAIRAAIVRGEFVPNQRLVEADLSAQFEASRASVRSALLELTNEGLVERVQNRGARVRAVSLEEAVEISEVRMVLEGLCAAKAASRITAAEIQKLEDTGDGMRKAVSSGDLLGYSQLNQRLHHQVREISGQHTASHMLERLRAQSVRHQFRLAMHPGRPSVSLPEHLAIIEAVCAHDAEAAERAAREHLGSVIDALQEATRESPTAQSEL